MHYQFRFEVQEKSIPNLIYFAHCAG